MAEQFVVFNNIQDWFPPVVIQKDLITVPRISIDMRMPLPEGVLDKGKAFIKKIFDAKFDPQFTQVSKKAFGTMQSTIDAFQKQIAEAKANPQKSKLTEASLKKDLAELNTKLEFCVDQWKKALEKLAGPIFDEAVEKWDKEAKAKVNRAKTKVLVKALVLAAIVLTAAALTIVAVVATGGAAAVLIPAVIAASVAALGTLVKTYKDMTSGFKSRAKLCEDKVNEIKADILAIDKAMTPEQLTSPQKANFIKRYKVGTSLLRKHLGQLEKFHYDLGQQIAKIEKDLKAPREKLNTVAKDDPQGAKATQAAIDLFEGKLAALEKRLGELKTLQKAANDRVTLMDAAVDQGTLPKNDTLLKIIDAFGQTADFVTSIMDSGGKLAAAANAYEKALGAKK